jgi:histone H3/H4
MSVYQSIGDITKPAIHRLTQRVGIPRVSGLLYEEVRGILLVFLEEFLSRVFTHTDHERKKTISVNHVYAAMYPSKVLLTKKELGACVPKSKIPQICLSIPKAPFQRLIRDIVASFRADMRMQQEAALLIQYYTEMFLLKVLALAFLMAKQAERETVQPKDIQLARRALMIQL